jgi:hypothetical protein
LEKSTRPDIAYAVHQCARFSSNPKKSHEAAVRRIVRYLQGTKNKGINFKVDKSRSFECWVDADFAGNWRQEGAASDTMTSKSRSGWVILYANCPITWSSKLQTLTALSTTEAEYVALSTALREVIPLMTLSMEMKAEGVWKRIDSPIVHCKVFEDNAGALEMAKLPKIRPRTKHINNYYHHFREWVEQGKISLSATASADQIADILTKPLGLADFVKFRQAIMNW